MIHRCLASLFLLTASPLLLLADDSPRPGRDSLSRAGSRSRHDVLDMFARSWVPGVSPQIYFVPRPGYDFADSAVPHDHGSPWDYDIHVPLLFHGPGQVRAMESSEPVRPYDLTATLSAAIGVGRSPGMVGRPLHEILVPGARRPKALLVVVMDQVGYQALEKRIDRLPTMSSMRRRGAWFRECRLDYLPAATAVTHAAVGTGGPPGVHGIINNTILKPTDVGLELRNAWSAGGDAVDPTHLLVPTFADWMDPVFGNRSVVISLVTKAYAACGLAGVGTAHPGGDRDFVVFYSTKQAAFVTDERYYAIPDYIASREVITPELEAAYAAHGQDHSVASGVRILPEFARIEADNILEMMDREGVGTDEVPDLVMVNLKTTDMVGHFLGRDHPNYIASLKEIDRFLREAESLLRRRAGPGRYLMAVTSDHGGCPADGVRVDRHRFGRDLGKALDEEGDRDGRSAILGTAFGLLFVDSDELADEGLDLSGLRDRVAEDPRVLHAFTVDEVRARRVLLDFSGH